MKNGDEPADGLDARDHRRWLIGVGISLVFGLFGVVMALLSYSARTKPGGPSDRAPAAQEPANEQLRRGNPRRDRHR